MLFNVPQFIDIEDKIVGPLTAKQLGWLIGGGVILLVFFNTLDTSAFIFFAVIVAGIFGALAFYKPNNQTLLTFLLSSVYFLFRPKLYIWKRLPDTLRSVKKSKKKKGLQKAERKKLDYNKIKEVSEILDKNV